ncbi:MAG TPA: hypothetical protein VFF11_08700, partial [Candidatus Binatia bacterium]|nr:hypothetical protein [Candidatus Binatia bacterium]
IDEMNPDPKHVSDFSLRRDSIVSARLPLEQADQCPEDLLNRIIWRAMKGPRSGYPEWAITPHADDDD